jgi:cholest-4-en-3-one 26-monooxygenase
MPMTAVNELVAADIALETGGGSLDDLDITTPELYQQAVPFAAFEVLRRQAPVYWCLRPGFEPFWAITKHADVSWIERHPEIFSSGSRNSLSDIDHLEVQNSTRQRRAQEAGCPFEKPHDLLYMDPPVHRDHRSAMSASFSRRLITQFEGTLSMLARRYVDEFVSAMKDADGKSVNAVETLAGKLPITAISIILGVPGESWRDVEQWLNTLFSHRVVGDEDAEARYRETVKEYRRFTIDLIRRRRDDPQDDLVSRLAAAEIGGARLTDREIADHLGLLFGAGYETTRTASTMGLNALLRHPAELRKLVQNPHLLNPAVEEILRWTSPVIQFSRVCQFDTEIRGQRIRRGETVVMFFPSANRDEEVFTDPYRFDITRDPNPHIAFGGGEHFCLGVTLARAELRALFSALLPVLPRIELVGQPEMVPNSLVAHAVERLPVRLRPERGE